MNLQVSSDDRHHQADRLEVAEIMEQLKKGWDGTTASTLLYSERLHYFLSSSTCTVFLVHDLNWSEILFCNERILILKFDWTSPLTLDPTVPLPQWTRLPLLPLVNILGCQRLLMPPMFKMILVESFAAFQTIRCWWENNFTEINVLE